MKMRLRVFVTALFKQLDRPFVIGCNANASMETECETIGRVDIAAIIRLLEEFNGALIILFTTCTKIVGKT
jgi:hypothetical protein